ncbi:MULTISPECIES: DUF2612 domain-containing protein [Lysinibacillus]|jgi:hypothetical protein|uniref:DUF2612 domain-containing protein n=1 Tax=Lysinibacillus TaxID=400634 RepID=UPI0004D9BFE1|nr:MULTISPECIES: DUF2612 domain-containing protein [Lysinibacillus]AJK87692.1 hypothetical protein HR49_11265 [Lysinibacillus fusiformis]KHK48674.1 hypothetical protein PI85_22250 [Lysinibacillus sp. A1]
MFSTKSIVKRFSDYFDKTPDSNISKLMSIFSAEAQKIKETNDRIRQWRNIDDAEGVGLDLIGQNVNQSRGVANDEVYRILLKSKIARNLSDGTIDMIIQVLAIALSIDPKMIKIKEKWNDQEEPEPAAIKVIELPLTKLNEAGLDPTNFVRIVQRTVAAGVKVGVIELTGTFEFGDLTNSIDNTKGFGDINDDTIGGYLGAAYAPSQDNELPI